MIDYEKLRNDLIDYFGTAFTLNPLAMVDLFRVQNASDEELVDIAKRNGFMTLINPPTHSPMPVKLSKTLYTTTIATISVNQ